MLGNIKKAAELAALVLLCLLGSCSQEISETERQTNIEIITASVVEDMEGSTVAEAEIIGCEYGDGSVCSDECCSFESDCGTYKKCDLELNEWLESNYTDDKCLVECRKEIQEDEITEEDKERTRELLEGFMESIKQEEAKTCIEGWICANSTWRAYQMSDCALFGQVKCENGCSNSKCEVVCDKGERKCKGDKIMVCREGSSWETYERCENGCYGRECIKNEIIEFQNTSQDIGNTAQNETQNGNNESSEQSDPEDQDPLDFACGSGCIMLRPSESNFTGTVNCANNVLEEHIVFKSRCLEDVNLHGWNLSDKTGNTIALNFTLKAGSSVKIITGKGSNTDSEIFSGKCTAIWNNDGDIIFLRNSEGEKIMEVSYGKELIPQCVHP